MKSRMCKKIKNKWSISLGSVLCFLGLAGCSLGGNSLETADNMEGQEQEVTEGIVSENEVEPEQETEPEEPHIIIDAEASACDLSRAMPVKGRPIDQTYGEVLAYIGGQPEGAEVDLMGHALTYEEIADILQLTQGQDVSFLYNVPLGEVVIPYDTAEIMVSEMPLAEMDGFDFDTFISLFPNLESIEMCNCGYTNDEMAAICDNHEDLRIIWEVHLEHWDFRTDIVAFTSDKTCADDFYMQNEDAKYLKYCKDLLALDLGHNYVNDLSFLEKLTNLRVLILVDNVVYKRPDGSLHHLDDLSVLSNLTEMRYLEFFSNAVSDISFLNNMPKLMDLNISYNPIYDAGPLYNHPRLVRLWMEHTYIPASQVSALRAAYPNTIIVSEGEGSIDQGWRANEHYYAMRRMFHENAVEDVFMQD